MTMLWAAGVAAGALMLVTSCANNPSGFIKPKTGSAEIWASIEKSQSQNVMAKEQRTDETTWDSLVVVTTGPDMDSIISAFKFIPDDPYISASVENVPAGQNRIFEVYTKTKAGLYIHTSASQTGDISASEVKALDFTLVPVRGSIYVDLSDIPTSVAEVCAAFGGLSTCANRSTKLFLSIDDILDGTSDSLIVDGTDTAGLDVYRSAVWLEFSVLHDTSVSGAFYTVTTGAGISVSAQMPGITVVSGDVGSQRTIAGETGRIIISEIMYNANDSEYVEVYNPLDEPYNDSLLVELDGTCRSYGVVSIGPKSFFVIGRKSLPWADAYSAVSTALDLSSGGNWLCLRSKAAGDTVLDWVAFTGGSNDQEWPNLGTAKKSIVLDSLSADPAYNNYGRNWSAAQTLISQLYPSASTAQCGTPKTAGL